MKEKTIALLGWAATVTAILMYFSYIDQIRLNLAGGKGSTLQPAATIANCVLWTVYGWCKPRKDWPIIVANVPGIVLGAAALITAL